jgi:hypothetical protein
MPELMQEEKVKLDRLLETPFNNQLWRTILLETSTIVSAHYPFKLDVISPFGFELLERKRYLSGQLRRFYIYIGVPEQANVNKEKLTEHFKTILVEKLKRIETNFLDHLIVSVENEKIKRFKENNYICKDHDKLIDFQIRSVNSGDVLSDYANYVIATLHGIHHNKGETRQFETLQICRWRLYQIYIMQEALFGYLLPMTKHQKALFSHVPYFLSNRIHVFYKSSDFFKKPSNEEYEIICSHIKPRIKELYEIVTDKNSRRKTIKCTAYHVPDCLEIKINELLYEKAFHKIKQTYLAFI